MEIEVLKEKETPLLSRKRISAMAYYEGSTPSRIKILNEVAKKLKADVKLVSIRHIYTRFGSPRAKLIVHLYKDRKAYEVLEGKKLVDKHTEKKAEQKEGAASA
jgi:small subunit ribosomal protein S24e